MAILASPFADAALGPPEDVPQPDASLGAILAALEPLGALGLVIDCAGRRVQTGYHVTEVKAASFVALDCGGQPDAWSETILQVEDLPSEEGATGMTAAQFCSILTKVARALPLDMNARLTFEVSGPGAPMQVYDAADVDDDGFTAVLRLVARPALCKPRHRRARPADGQIVADASSGDAACCSPRTACGA